MAGNGMRVPVIGQQAAMPEYEGVAKPVVAGVGLSQRLSGEGGADRGKDYTAMIKAGQNLSRAGKVGLGLYMDYQGYKAREGYDKYVQQSMKEEARLSELRGEQAWGEQGVQAQLQSWQQHAKNAITKDMSETAKGMFNRAVGNRDAQLAVFARKHVEGEYRAWQKATDDAHIATLSDIALSDPSRLTDSLGGIWVTIQQQAHTQGMPKEWADAQYEKTRKELGAKIAGNEMDTLLLNDDLAGARQQLNSDMSVEYLTPAQRNAYKRSIDAEQKRREAEWKAAQAERERAAQDEAIAGNLEIVLKGVDPNASYDEQMGAVITGCNEITDEKQREAVRRQAEQQVRDNITLGKAAVATELRRIDEVIAKNSNLSPLDIYHMVQNPKVSPEVRSQVLKTLSDEREGKANEENSRRGLVTFMNAVDASNGTMPDTEKQALMIDLKLNAGDRAKAWKYMGLPYEYSFARIQPLINSTFGKGKLGDSEQEKLYAALIYRMGKDRWDDKTIKNELSMMYRTKGDGFWGDRFYQTTLKEQENPAENRRGLFRADIPDDLLLEVQRKAEEQFGALYTGATDKAKKLILNDVFMSEYLHEEMEYTDEEKAIMQASRDSVAAKQRAERVRQMRRAQ